MHFGRVFALRARARWHVELHQVTLTVYNTYEYIYDYFIYKFCFVSERPPSSHVCVCYANGTKYARIKTSDHCGRFIGTLYKYTQIVYFIGRNNCYHHHQHHTHHHTYEA